MPTLFNANTRSAYQAGFYTGVFPVADGCLRRAPAGGHVFDFAVNRMTVQAGEADGYTTRLPATAEFRELDLTPCH